jgi:hypothetical protein
MDAAKPCSGLHRFNQSFLVIDSNGKPHPKRGAAVVNLSRRLEQVAATPCTAWRWRKKGWLRTVRIVGDC